MAEERDSGGAVDSCTALNNLRADADAFMADLLDAALAVKAEQGLDGDAEAFDYTVSFLSGIYRAFALTVRETTIEAMHE